ncbi:MAG: hydroxylamine reductase [Bacteroidales bacterium]|nr:hydroxylamine reductase [Bacteroidales bacterium]MDD3201849.1 hydroxylamine reductase [Bacteroidales bacterium]
MFCYQCQETAQNRGCTIKGVCGKSSDVANLQDLLIYLLKGVSHNIIRMQNKGMDIPVCINRFVTESLFMTITNANFDKKRFVQQIEKAMKVRSWLTDQLGKDLATCPDCDCTTWTGNTLEEMEAKGATVSVLATNNEDIRSLRELLTYGVKGMAAYAEHAKNLGYEDPEIYAFIEEALVATTNNLSVDELTSLVLKCGEYGVKTMALLDRANTDTYGHPEVTKVDIGVRNNPAILISGHDLRDLKDLLDQTEGTGIDVYTHGEMLPAHYYPAFKKYSHFAGNYGGAWWNQNEDFEAFNGVILFTTNCIVPPRENSKYADRVYTTGAAGFSGFPHIEDRKENGAKDFSALIAHAKHCKAPTEREQGQIIGGFAHDQVFALADKVVNAVKSGAIKKFVVMAGCDGRMKSRNYYTEFAERLPKDTVILTAGCAKYRYNKLPLGDIGGIPRVLDAGQCNDSYSLALIALKLKEVFNLSDINELPIVYNIAWYEQKAVIVLLALLYLGVKNIHLGPTLPAFLSPNVAKVLVDNFGIGGITTVEEDLKMFLS